VLVMFNQGSGLQIVVAFVISLFFVKLYGHFGEYLCTHTRSFVSPFDLCFTLSLDLSLCLSVSITLFSLDLCPCLALSCSPLCRPIHQWRWRVCTVPNLCCLLHCAPHQDRSDLSPFSSRPDLTADVISGAGLVYDVLLVLLLFSIFFLSLFRLRLESKQREDVYRRYITAATASAPPAQDDQRKAPPGTLTDPNWQYWSARLEDGLQLTDVS
jgi:hypothetical protein